MNVLLDKKILDSQLTDWYFTNRDQLMAASNSVFNSFRPEAMECFRKMGIPDKSNENYKYTDVREVFLTPFNRYIEPRKILFSVEDLFRCDIPELDTELVLLVNGWFYENRPRLEVLPNGIIIGSMAEAARQYPHILEAHYSRYADFRKDALVALNTGFAQDGTFIYIPKGVGQDRTIQVVNILLSPEDLFVQHRNLVVIEDNAMARVVVCDHSLSAHHFLTNSVTEIFVGQNARLDYTKLQNEHNSSNQLSSSFVHQEKDSHAIFNTITLHGGMIRNNVYTRLNGPGAENHTLGLFLADRNQHVDSYTYVDHAAPGCTSRQNFKGILDEKATGAFTGRILVRPDAQKTLAYQANNNILLTSEARMNTKPQLEIYADDVKCSHGATVGQLDENAMFYLQTRGIAKREARLLLMGAFGHEILKQVPVEPLRDRLNDLVDKRLKGELSRCNSCPLQCQETC
ncbi:MAG: Fe-S cluster assembly protein SufD [Bacteroidetes bacterium GWF2_49_14]|nr:MAG: Fe-S cluster assembly protein SufD [Bacteroidetes bacterium GWF2_49_14]